MWTAIRRESERLLCAPPFSFYFDLVQKYWKSSHDGAEPLHRMCTIARKMDVKTVIIEYVVSRPDIEAEIDALDLCQNGDHPQNGHGEAEIIAVNFFSTETDLESLAEADKDSFLGQAIIINYKKSGNDNYLLSYVYEAVFIIPRTKCAIGGHVLPLLNNYIYSDVDFNVLVRDVYFKVKGIYYSQQNNITSVCAHACLRMAVNSYQTGSSGITNAWINKNLFLPPPDSRIKGLSLKQIMKIIHKCGLAPVITDCLEYEHAAHMSALHSTIDSGYPALLVFTTNNESENSPVDHVVLVFGHTRNSDEWHPQAIPAYAGHKSAPYYPASAWADHYLIHDDSFGPYYTFASRSLEIESNVKARYIISLYPKSVVADSVLAENASSMFMAKIKKVADELVAKYGESKWLKYMAENNIKYVLRTVLITREEYIEHISSAIDHDNQTLDKTSAHHFNSIPDIFWMVEISLPHIYTGNRGKLGELIVAADIEHKDIKCELIINAVRLPGVFIYNEFQEYAEIDIKSHINIYRSRKCANEW